MFCTSVIIIAYSMLVKKLNYYKANINHYSPHKLRKTYSSLLLSSSNALQLKDIQHQLRHTNLNTTMKYLFPLQTSEQLCGPIDDIFKNLQ